MAVIVAGGIFGLLALIIIVAVLVDIPKRRKRRQHKGIMEPESKKSLEIQAIEIEKESANASVNDVASQSPSTNYSNYSTLQPTRSASPECQCEHPIIVQNPPRK